MKTKNVILSAMVVSIGLLSYSAKAQANNMQQDSVHNKMQHPKTDHIMMQNGKMMVMKEGDIMPMEKNMTMKNGTKCMTDGTYITKDGKKSMMKEGEMMDMNGKMMMDMKKDDN